MKETNSWIDKKKGLNTGFLCWDLWKLRFQTHIWVKFGTHFWDLQDLRILRGPKMENRSPPGPKLCYLFQAGIPEIGLLRVSDPKIGQIDRVLTSSRGQNSLSQRGNRLSDHRFWPPRGQKWPLRDPKSVSQTWKIDPIFLILRWEKLPSFILDH